MRHIRGSWSSIPPITSWPKYHGKRLSFSITWANPLSIPNSTAKYGSPLGMDPRIPLFLVSTSFLFWAHSSSDSRIAFLKYIGDSCPTSKGSGMHSKLMWACRREVRKHSINTVSSPRSANMRVRDLRNTCISAHTSSSKEVEQGVWHCGTM